MLSHTLNVLQRLAGLVEEHRLWFSVLGDWYQHTKRTRRAVEERLRGVRAPGGVAVIVNGRVLERLSEVTDARAARLTWLLPSNVLQEGRNEVTVRLDQNASGKLVLAAASFEQDYHLPWQTLSLALREPQPTANLALTSWRECFFTGAHWSVEPLGLLQFQLVLPLPGPVNFTLQLGEGRASAWLALLQDLGDKLREEVRDAVKERLWQAVAEAGQEWLASNPRAQALRHEVQTLSSYLRLDQQHLQTAFTGPPDGTLEDIIAQVGWPQDPTTTFQTTSVSLEVEPVLVKPLRRLPAAEVLPEAEVIPLAEPVEVYPTTQRLPPRPPIKPPPVAGGMGAGAVAKIVVTLGLLGGGLYLWNNGTLGNWWQQVAAWAEQVSTTKDDGKNQVFRERLKTNNAQTGEVQVSLFWNNKNDLDLHVESPFKVGNQNEHLYFGSARKPAFSPSGGQLDVDANVGVLREDPVENIHWPPGKAPKGLYKVKVVLFSKRNFPGCEDPTRFTVRILVRGREEFFQGEVSSQNREVIVREFRVD